MQHLRAGTKIHKWRGGKNGVCRYAAKYAAKQSQKQVPKFFIAQKEGSPEKETAGRAWGIFGSRTVKLNTAGFKFTPEMQIGGKPAEFFWIQHFSGEKTGFFARPIHSKNEFVEILVIDKTQEFEAWWRVLKKMEEEFTFNWNEYVSRRWRY